MIKVIEQAEYWNTDEIVSEFSKYDAPEYWKSFFTELDRKCYTKVLDIGCGGGRNSLLAMRLGFDIYACDAHEKMLQATKTKIISNGYDPLKASERITKAEFTKLPYKAGYFDVVVSSGVLHNGDTAGILQLGIFELSRVLKAGGFLCLNVFIKGEELNFLKSTNKCDVYLNEMGLPIILSDKNDIFHYLRINRMIPFANVCTYKSKINNGERKVLRGIFKKV